jgi:hypothetical protein
MKATQSILFLFAVTAQVFAATPARSEEEAVYYVHATEPRDITWSGDHEVCTFIPWTLILIYAICTRILYPCRQVDQANREADCEAWRQGHRRVMHTRQGPVCGRPGLLRLRWSRPSLPTRPGVG